tara:strand:+ start:1140 stop:1331 length:192 start_codon:yes stop_codon:yes gene_type:complete
MLKFTKEETEMLLRSGVQYERAVNLYGPNVDGLSKKEVKGIKSGLLKLQNYWEKNFNKYSKEK